MKNVRCVIVLGDRPVNGVPTEEMRRRVEKGIEIADRLHASFIIYSGGRTSGEVSEALLMQEIAEGMGCKVPAILEHRSLDTLGNAYFCARIMEHLSGKSAVVITGPGHLMRARRLFSYVFGRNVRGYTFGTEAQMSPKEKEAYTAAMLLLRGVRRGDLDTIWKRMKARHPLYQDFS
ncbi:MAG: YdcF family protein [Methanomassiliicoccales archaeon]